MRALEFWKAVAVDHSALLERLTSTLAGHGIRNCVVGGQAVNAYVEPLVSLDLDLAVAAEGLPLPVARVEDVLQGKIWAAQDARRRPSKRQKDLADIARLIEARPELRARVPDDVLGRLI